MRLLDVKIASDAPIVEDFAPVMDVPMIFRLRWRPLRGEGKQHPFRVEVEVWESVARECNTQEFFFQREGGAGIDWVDDIDLAAVHLRGLVTWDGTAEFEVPDRLYFGGAGDFARHGILMEHLYCRAMELMGRGDERPVSGPPVS